MAPRRSGRRVAVGVALAALAAGAVALAPRDRIAGPEPAAAAVAPAAAASAPPPPRIVSLAVPKRPAPPPPFRTLPESELAELVEMTDDGLRLPKVAASGWLPWIAYARRFEVPARAPRVGILMINLGADETLTRRAIEELPGEVSLAFLPGSPDLGRWLQLAHERGHESYLMLPMEDQAIPAERGLKPLHPTVEPAENVRRLRLAMARGEGYVGFVMVPTLPAWQFERVARPVVREIARRGLGLVEVNPVAATTTVQRLTEELATGYARTGEVLDYNLADGGLAASLDRLDAWASEAGPDQPPRHRFGVVQPEGDAIDTLAAWMRGRPRQPVAVLVPVIGHFECREPCLERLRAQPGQLKP